MSSDPTANDVFKSLPFLTVEEQNKLGLPPVTYFDSQTFTPTELERLPCGHELRKNMEMLLDLRASYGPEGAEAWEQALAGIRLKHAAGCCAEVMDPLVLAARIKSDAPRTVRLVLIQGARILFPHDRFEPPGTEISLTNDEF